MTKVLTTGTDLFDSGAPPKEIAARKHNDAAKKQKLAEISQKNKVSR